MKRIVGLSLSLLLALLILGAEQAYAIPDYNPPQLLIDKQSSPLSIAVDGNGTVYWIDGTSGQIRALIKVTSSAAVILKDLNTPKGLVADSSGNLYFSEYTRGTISILPKGSSQPIVLIANLSFPSYLSVDTLGNIYFITGEICGDKIVKFDRYSRTLFVILTASGSRDLNRGFGGVFIHPSGDLYYTTCGVGTVEKLPRASSNPEILASGYGFTSGVAADNDGNVFFIEYDTAVRVIPKGTGTSAKLASDGTSRHLLTIDQAGDLYYNDFKGGMIWKIPRLIPQSPPPAPPPLPAFGQVPAPNQAPAQFPQPQVIVKEVVKEVPVEVIKEVIKEVPKEVIKEVIKEVPKEVIKEVPKEVIKEVPKEGKEVSKEGTRTETEALTLGTLGSITYSDIRYVVIGAVIGATIAAIGVAKRKG